MVEVVPTTQVGRPVRAGARVHASPTPAAPPDARVLIAHLCPRSRPAASVPGRADAGTAARSGRGECVGVEVKPALGLPRARPATNPERNPV